MEKDKQKKKNKSERKRSKEPRGIQNLAIDLCFSKKP